MQRRLAESVLPHYDDISDFRSHDSQMHQSDVRPNSLGTTVGMGPTQATTEYDGIGAGYYVIAVVMVYGMSIVMMIAASVRRKHTSITQDQQVDKYLRELEVFLQCLNSQQYSVSRCT